jgi:hypothetical protein
MTWSALRRIWLLSMVRQYRDLAVNSPGIGTSEHYLASVLRVILILLWTPERST